MIETRWRHWTKQELAEMDKYLQAILDAIALRAKDSRVMVTQDHEDEGVTVWWQEELKDG